VHYFQTKIVWFFMAELDRKQYVILNKYYFISQIINFGGVNINNKWCTTLIYNYLKVNLKVDNTCNYSFRSGGGDWPGKPLPKLIQWKILAMFQVRRILRKHFTNTYSKL